MGDTAAVTAREVEITRKEIEDKVAKLSARAPQEARKIAERAAWAGLTAVAVIVARKAAAAIWRRATGEAPPTK